MSCFYAAGVFVAGALGVQLQAMVTPPGALDALSEYWPSWQADELLAALIVGLVIALAQEIRAIGRMRQSRRA